MTNTPIIEFDADFPSEVRPLIESLLKEHLWLCPLWMQKVGVSWQGYETEYHAQWILQRDYRMARLCIAPSLLNYADWEKREMMIHEIIHSYTIPLKTAAFDAFDDLKIDDPVKTILERQINKVMEQVTQDFAFAIARKPAV